jgi:Superinfection immunity protein
MGARGVICMRKLSRFAAITVLFFPSVVLHAASGDAAAVLQRCGAPLSDGLTALDATDGQQRMINYPAARLYFEHDGAGWSFLFSNQARNTNLNRVQTANLMPCFLQAKRSVKGFGTRAKVVPAAVVAAAAVPAPAPVLTQRQRIVTGLRRIRPTMWVAMGLLYLLPSIVGAFRVAERLGYLTLIDVLTGWTVVGWMYAMLIAIADQSEPPADDHQLAPAGKGVVKLKAAA